MTFMHPVWLALALVSGVGLSQESAPRLRGFSERSSHREREFESHLRKRLSPRRTEEHLRWLTSRPHRTGTEGARVTAEYLHRELEKYGFETETVRYDALLPAPISVSIELVEPVRESIPIHEDRIEEDPFTSAVGEHPGWNGFSASGEATAEVVYAHHGSSSDLRALEAMGVDLQGKILLLRYFGTGEGRKVRNAERAGAAAVVLYSDPEEDGYPYGDVYPDGNWRPPGAIMRRSVEFLPYSGDPLSPGWASLPGAKRLRPEDVDLPKIPVLPISYRSAGRILSHLSGPSAPWAWQGALALNYKIGPGPAKLHVRTEMEHRDRPMWNVIGTLKGAELPDQWVMVGNHHDAWIYGAGDPSSGTASLLELARCLGELAGDGHRPRRTLIIGFWDAEEMLLGGSTEWVEHRGDELLEKLIAYINMDSSVFNVDRPLSVAAHPVLHRLFRSVARDIVDPRTGGSLFEVWRDLQNEFRQVPSVDGWGEFFDTSRELTEPWIFAIPYDDATPFFYYLAMPASDMYYGADYGMYHSIYENFHWMKNVVDPTFEYHVLMAELQGLVALRLANADVLPLDYAGEARYWRMAYQDLQNVSGRRVPRLGEAYRLIDAWEDQAQSLDRNAAAWLETAKLDEGSLAELNRKIFQAARNFLGPEGPLGAPRSRNLFAGAAGTLSGIRAALEEQELEAAKAEAALYIDALRRRVATLEAINEDLQ